MLNALLLTSCAEQSTKAQQTHNSARNAETTWCTASLARWTNTFLSSKSIDTSFKYNDYTVFARHCVQAIYKTSQFYA